MRWFAWVMMAALLAQADRATARKATDALAATMMAAWPKGLVATTKNPGSWGYEEGVLLDGLAADWEVDHDAAKLKYIRAAVDKYVRADGTIQMDASGRVFASGEHQLDNIELGRAVLFVYRQAKEARYVTAARFLHEQLGQQPRTASGGYWHKTIYPNQMWLDGAYMAEPFRAEYAAMFHVPEDFEDVARQFLLMDEHMRDPKSGLLKHGWDESRKMPWADKATGLSPEVWARAMGWYCMALVDVLDWFPAGHVQRKALIGLLNRDMAEVMRYQDGEGLWWQVMGREVAGGQNLKGARGDKAEVPAASSNGNFPEASASAMFVYALAKGVRKGYLPAEDRAAAQRGWEGIQKRFIKAAPDGAVILTGTVKAAGLGGTPYRSGTFEYYVAEKTGDNDAKGVGAYLLAGSEMER